MILGTLYIMNHLVTWVEVLKFQGQCITVEIRHIEHLPIFEVVLG